MKFVVPSIGSITQVKPLVPGVVARFLSDDPVVGKSRVQRLADEDLDVLVGLADEVLVALALHRQAAQAVKILQRQLAGLAHDALGLGRAPCHVAQNATWSAPFSASLSRASAGVATLSPSASTIVLIRRTCSAFDIASSPRPM